MTPERCVGLSALLMDLRDYLIEEDAAPLDAALADAVIDVCVRLRNRLVEDGAR